MRQVLTNQVRTTRIPYKLDSEQGAYLAWSAEGRRRTMNQPVAQADDLWELAFRDDDMGVDSDSSSSTAPASTDEEMGTTLEMAGAGAGHAQAQPDQAAHYQQVLNSNNTAADGRRMFQHYPNLTNQEFYQIMGMGAVFNA